LIAEIIIDEDSKALDKVFDYNIPDDMQITTGMRVFVPFSSKTVQGYVVNIKETTDCPINKLKSVISPIENFNIIKPEMLKLMEYMCRKYHLRMTSTLRLFIPSEIREGKVKELFEKICVLNDGDFDFGRAKKQEEIARFLQGKEVALSELKEMFGYSTIKTMIDKNIIQIRKNQILRKPLILQNDDKKVVLNEMQKDAICAISEDKVYLLHGVTGSGKTEVYMNLISNKLKEGKTAIMLVPEISLTPQVLANFRARFGNDIAILHSGLTSGEKLDEWKRIFSGDAKVVVGARSAIFAPMENIGIIIIDEEHEQSYVSESNPRYDTHDVAEFRAKFNHCPLVLGSATPSVDSYEKAINGEYKLLELPVRANGRELPKIQIVDMMMEIRSGNSGMFSNQLLADLVNVVNNKKQAMLFINRRGYSSFMRCKDCGYVAKCQDCDVTLVHHKAENKLKCHYCGRQYKVLDVCPNCGSERIKEGAVGTEQVVSELRKYFPDVKILRMDNDTTSKKNSHAKILEEFKNSKPGILVGTQMIAKGHDFEDVILVGIIDADQSLYHSDYRSTERCFQLITQVSGRAGRSKDEGKVVLQTYSPRAYTYKFAANYDYKGFFRKEENLRKTANFPPFTRIIRILFSNQDENILKEELKVCYNKLQNVREKFGDEIIYLDVMKSPVKRIQNKFRYQVVIRCKLDRVDEIEQDVFECTKNVVKSSVFFEINPQNMS